MSFQAFKTLLSNFSMISDYKIDDGKSILMNIAFLYQLSIKLRPISPWWKSGIRYLEVSISSDLSGLVASNIISLTNAIKKQLAHWSKFKLSWFGRIADCSV